MSDLSSLSLSYFLEEIRARQRIQCTLLKESNEGSCDSDQRKTRSTAVQLLLFEPGCFANPVRSDQNGEEYGKEGLG